MITLADYWMGRDATHSWQLGSDLRAEAGRTVEVANKLLVLAKVGGVTLDFVPGTASIVTSGWRPADVNAITPNAKPRSLHIRCQAIDLYDPYGDLDEWLLANADTVFKDLGLWLEHPAATRGWAHVQTRPPGSGRRVFYP